MSIPAVSVQTPPPATTTPAMQRGVESREVSPKKAAQPELAKPAASKPQEIEQAVESVQKFIQPMASNLQFTIDEDTGIKVVKVIDTATKDVIRQFPSEEILQIAKALDKLQGILIEQKA